MADETPKLTLGFVGNDEVHRNNSLALLRDLVGGFLKQHRKADVEIILVVGAPSATMADIEDWAATSGYGISTTTVGSMVTELLKEENARLILVGDPAEEERVYAVAEEAAKYKIQTRSLLNGLERVVFDDDLDEDELGEGFHEVDLDEPDIDDDLLSEPDGITAPDLDVLAVLADDGEVDAQEEIKGIAAALDIDVTPFETWTDAIAAIRGVGEDQTEVDPEYEPDPPDEGETVIADLPPVEIADADGYFDPEAQPLAPVTVYTREYLESLDFDKVKAIGLDHGIAQGRGMKKVVYINKILVLNGEETAEQQAKIKRPKKAPKVTDLAPVVETPLLIEVPPEATITPIRADEANNVRLALVAELRGIADRLELL